MTHQQELFAANPVHYGPTKSPGLPNWHRVALCGVTYRIAGDLSTPPEPIGTSDLAGVTCGRCLGMAEAKR